MISSGKYTGQRATQEIYDYVRTQEKETIGTAFVGVMPDLARAIKHPATMISTDAGLSDKPGEGHPQDSGTYPRVFQRLNTKGWLGTGADADIVV
jgi:N-acyl-D-amino-acid deacylase